MSGRDIAKIEMEQGEVQNISEEEEEPLPWVTEEPEEKEENA
jgi:hypothetical protein